jgi:purine-binding chemotaxis protein CheW
MSAISTDVPWVIFNLLDQQFAVSASYVREMVAMPLISEIPKSPENIRGLINIRGQVIPVMDLRSKLGMKSTVDNQEELVELFYQKEQDHKNWLAELESSVRENREFKLATDPHKCAFGKWYDNYKTENKTLATYLAKFDTPHQKIHAIAIKVKEMAEKGDHEGAFGIINRTRDDELAEMIRLFSQARTLAKESTHEIALVLQWHDKTMALSVDSVETVEQLSDSKIEELPDATSTIDNDCIAGLGKRNNDGGIVQLLDAGKTMGYADNIATELVE